MVDHYRVAICPDESLVQTVLLNARDSAGRQRFVFCNDNLRFVDNEKSKDGRPRLLGDEDFARLTSGSYHFARKFDSEAPVLDRLDAWLGS